MTTNTGGPAFPVSALVYNDDGVDPTTIIHDGMTLRDYFAAKAMQSYLSAWIMTKQHPETDLILAKHAYAMADAMLKAREE
jgi:hypothetical protein